MVNDHCIRDKMSDNALITISIPLDDFATGGGYLVLTNSAGAYAGDIDSKANFGFNVDLYPNPSTGKVNLFIHSSEILDSEVSLCIVTGGEIFRKKYKPAVYFQFIPQLCSKKGAVRIS